jgi:Ca2+-binding EF-hand superfamily protein
MNETEFGVTINNALSFIGLTASAEQISRLFKEIDLEKTGWITYEIYFLFLKYYFGSMRGEALPAPVEEVDPDK